jgi:hypothetical protein
MKRLIICLQTIFAISAQGFAADIIGQWTTTIQDDGDSIPCQLTFTKNDIAYSIEMSEEEESIGTIFMTIEVPGTYVLKGKKLRINLRKEDIYLKEKAFKPKDGVSPRFDKEPERYSDFIRQFEGLVSLYLGKYKEEICGSENVFEGELKIKKLTETTLILIGGDDQEIVFTRINE